MKQEEELVHAIKVFNIARRLFNNTTDILRSSFKDPKGTAKVSDGFFSARNNLYTIASASQCPLAQAWVSARDAVEDCTDLILKGYSDEATTRMILLEIAERELVGD